MPLSALTDKSREPAPADVAAVLGRAAAHWKRLVAEIQDDHGPLEELWNHGGPKIGWSLRLRDKKRVVAYCIPCERHFLVGVVLGEKAVAAARASKLPKDVLAAIEEAPTYAEGRGLRVPVRVGADVDAVLALVSLKVDPVEWTTSTRRKR
jgi:hypothetical protein